KRDRSCAWEAHPIQERCCANNSALGQSPQATRLSLARRPAIYVLLMRASVVLIGPTLPYRGGIARHTTMLHRALSKQSRSMTISFSRQYPGWLYPGKNDREKGMTTLAEPGVEYLIDSLNPRSWTRAISRV